MTATPPLRLYLDEDVDVRLAKLLAAHGLDCLTAAAAGNLGLDDESQLEFATQETRVLISHNREDFEQIAISWWAQQKEFAGILVAIRRQTVYDLARHVLPALGRYDQSGWRNLVLYA